MARKRKKMPSIKEEILNLLREPVPEEYSEKLGIAEGEQTTICRAIAMAQVKKGLDGDLKAAEFIEEISEETGQEKEDAFRLTVKVVGAENGNQHN